jgi:hypothetical protein
MTWNIGNFIEMKFKKVLLNFMSFSIYCVSPVRKIKIKIDLVMFRLDLTKLMFFYVQTSKIVNLKLVSCFELRVFQVNL